MLKKKQKSDLGPEEIVSQKTNIERVLKSAYETTPYFNNLINEISEDEDELNADFFSKLPVFDKGTIRRTGWLNFISGDYLDSDYRLKKGPRARIETTSGTTGTPMKILWNNNDYFSSIMNHWKFREKFGITPSSRYCTSLKHIPNGQAYQIEGNKLTFTSMLYSSETASNILGAINDFKPEWLFIQNSVLFTLLYWGEKIGMRFPESVKYIEYMGEPLSGYYRKYIEKRIYTPSSNMYGCTETNGISYECTYHNNHLLTDNVFVEIVDENGRELKEGEDGFVCVTGLHNTAMPILRYRLNDIAHIDKTYICPCGNRNPVITIKAARMPEFLMLDDPELCNGWAMYAPANKEIGLIEEQKGDIAFNFKMDSLDHYDLYVYKNPNRVENVERIIEDMLIVYGFPYIKFTVHQSDEYDSSKMSGILRKIDL